MNKIFLEKEYLIIHEPKAFTCEDCGLTRIEAYHIVGQRKTVCEACKDLVILQPMEYTTKKEQATLLQEIIVDLSNK